MAKKRMFSLGVIDTDPFLDMPLSAQALYFHLCLRADDDGFVGNPKRITANVGASIDDLKLLVVKRFLLVFEDGVIVIRHWRMHNVIKKDRYIATDYTEDLMLLDIKENGAYNFKAGLPEHSGAQMEHKWSADGAQMAQMCSAEENSIEEISKVKDRYIFVPPTVEEVAKYCQERNNTIDPELFVDWYSARNWYLSKGIKMKDWKAAVRTWERRGDGDKRIPGDRTTGTKAVFDLPEVF